MKTTKAVIHSSTNEREDIYGFQNSGCWETFQLVQILLVF